MYKIWCNNIYALLNVYSHILDVELFQPHPVFDDVFFAYEGPFEMNCCQSARHCVVDLHI